MGSFRSPILQEPWPSRMPVMLKRWRNAQRRPARRPGVYSDRISLDASNSPTNSKFFCQRIGFFLAFSMAEFRARSRLFHESGVLVLVLGLLFRWQYRDASVAWAPTKTEAGFRSISLAADAVNMLRNLRVAAGELRLRLGLGGKLDDAYVFSRDGGTTPYRP